MRREGRGGGRKGGEERRWRKGEQGKWGSGGGELREEVVERRTGETGKCTENLNLHKNMLS